MEKNGSRMLNHTNHLQARGHDTNIKYHPHPTPHKYFPYIIHPKLNMKEHVVVSLVESQQHLARDILTKEIVTPLYIAQFHRLQSHHI